MKRYSIIHVPVLSFFSKSLYRDVCFEWKGTGFAYLLLLLALCWIPAMVLMQDGLARFVDEEAPKVVSQIPVITITGGKASIEEPQPYIIRDPDTGNPLVVIDTTGIVTTLEETGGAALITETQAVFRNSDVETRTFSFQDIENFTLDQDRVTGWLGMLKRYTIPVMYPLVLGFSFIARIIQLLLYAAIGLLFASVCRCRRGYAELLRLSVVAVTPCIIIKTFLSTAQVSIPLAGLWYFLAAMGFLFFGVKATCEENEATPLDASSHLSHEG